MAKITWAAPSSEWRELWPGYSLDERLRLTATEKPDAVAVIDRANDVELTFGELDDLASRVAAGFVARGIDQGDVVAAQLPNCWQFVVLSCAATRRNAIFCPLSTAYRDAELIHMLRASQASMVVVPTSYRGEDYVAMAGRVAAQVGTVRSVIAVGTPSTPDVEVFEDLLGEERFPATPVDPDDPTFLLFTSGTEAVPKGIVHTHNTANFPLGVCSDLWGAGPDDTVLVAAPMGHGAGFQWCHREALYLGVPQVLLDQWSGSAAAALVRSEGCTYTFAPTRFLQDLLAEAATPGSDPIRMRLFVSGGSPIPRVLVKQARELMGCQVFAVYGQTECFTATSTGQHDPIDKISASDGKAIPGALVRIVDPAGNDVPSGEPGECITRGPHLAGGYLEGTAPGQQSFRSDGWLWTGDLCSMDDDGFIRVLGRTRDMVIRNGINISPAEVEGYLLEHDAIQAAAVVGQPDPVVGERICAFVVPRPGSDVVLEDVLPLFEAKRVAKFKWPERLIVIDQLPYSAVGKVQRQRLKEELQARIS